MPDIHECPHCGGMYEHEPSCPYRIVGRREPEGRFTPTPSKVAADGAYWQTNRGSYTALGMFIDIAKVIAVLAAIGTVIVTISVVSDDTIESSTRGPLAFGILFGGLLQSLLLFAAGALVDVFLGMDRKMSELVDQD